MKVLIFGDIHLAARYKYGKLLVNGFDSRLLEIVDTLDFIREYIKENQIDMVIFLGDLFRTSLPDNEWILNYTVSYFKDIYESVNNLIMLVGNHDVKNANWKTFLHIFKALGDLGNNKLYILDQPSVINLDDLCILAYPFMLEQSHDFCLKMLDKKLKKTNCKQLIGIGHITVAGAVTGVKNFKFTTKNGGIDPNDLAFEDVNYWFLGHIHKHQVLNDKIVYVGSPDYISKSEWNDEKGFIVYDSDVKSYEFVKTPVRKFKELELDANKLNKKSLRKAIEKEDADYVYCKISGEMDNIIKMKKYIKGFQELAQKILFVKYDVISVNIKQNENVEIDALDVKTVLREMLGNYKETLDSKIYEKLVNAFEEIMKVEE